METQTLPTTTQPSDEDGTSAFLTETQAEDVDLAHWLSGEDTADLVDFFVLRDGKRLKIAAITDGEQQLIENASREVNPLNPKGPRKLNPGKWRRNLIALSINKANGVKNGERGYVTEQALLQRPTGELTEIQKAIFKLSGFQDVDGTSRSDEALAL